MQLDLLGKEVFSGVVFISGYPVNRCMPECTQYVIPELQQSPEVKMLGHVTYGWSYSNRDVYILLLCYKYLFVQFLFPGARSRSLKKA